MSEAIRSGFERQRRNLILLGAAISFVELTGVKFEKINILGNEAVINQPDAIVMTMWLLLLYWLVRFLNYFHDLGDTGYKDDLLKVRNSLVVTFTRQLFPRSSEIKKWLKNLSDKEEMFIYYNRHHIHKSDFLNMKFHVGFLLASNPDKGGHVYGYEFSISGWKLFLATIYSFLKVSFLGRYFGEYIFPLVIVIFAVVVKTGVVNEHIIRALHP